MSREPLDEPTGHGPDAPPPVFVLSIYNDRPIVSFADKLGEDIHEDGLLEHVYYCDEAFDALTLALGYEKPLPSKARDDVPNYGLTDDQFADVTKATRAADLRHRSEGGGTRHWLRDHFLPELDFAGFRIVRKP